MPHFARNSSAGSRRANQSPASHMRWNHAPASRIAREVSAARVLNQYVSAGSSGPSMGKVQPA